MVAPGNLIAGNVRSCGCIAKQRSREQLLVHGDTGTRLHGIWCSMRRRCDDQKCKDYKNYGARGITYCEEWREYIPFRDWALSHGYNDSLSIDRIDVDGNYEPNNCRWTDMKAQANNKRNNHYITYNGETHTAIYWSEFFDIPPKTLLYRLKAGWDLENAFHTPVDHSNRLVKHS